jgi:hypothetical protein
VVASKTLRLSHAILWSMISARQRDVVSVDDLFALTTDYERVELADRDQNGISVVLHWTRGTKDLAVTVADASTGDYFELVVGDNERPLDVFYHPFAYARARGVELVGDRRGVEVGVDG